jgi:DNA repair photolyase
VPQPKEKLKALEQMGKELTLVIRLDPLIYPLNTAEIKPLIRQLKNCGAKQIITSTYKVRPDNFKRMSQEFPEYKNLWQKLYFREGEKLGGYLYLPKDLREKLIQEVRQVSLEENLDFSSCREGYSELNTKNCDGSSFFV